MRLANLRGRAALIVGDGSRAVDIASASAGRFGPGLPQVYAAWPAVVHWAQSELVMTEAEAGAYAVEDLEAPSPSPTQVFAIGLNYRAHAAEVGADLPTQPVVFTKFASSLTGPVSIVEQCPTMDWEAELVVIMGRRGRDIPAASAWEHVAGLTAGQDISHRGMQGSGPTPQQWSLAKSLRGFSPTGPWLVTVDEFADVEDIGVEAVVNGEIVQSARTSDLIFTIPQVIEYLSAIVELAPGDLIFTGTPSGVAVGRPDTPWLTAGDRLVTRIEGIGELRQVIVAS